MARTSTATPLSAPLLPDHPQLLHRDKCGEHTVWVSPDLPAGMARSNGQWSLNDFQLTKQLYKGKASTLYQAVDKPSGRVVALKSYSKRRLSTLNWYQVEREVRLHAQLHHPNILALHAAFEDDNYVFMITEFAEGGDLYEDLKRAGGQMKERMVAGEVLLPFISALTFMHANCIIHRDIKPENILLAADRSVKVADFGLSINWGEERPVTRAGTLDYMSPEVLCCPEKSKPEENKERLELGYTDAVDVWAVGVLAYELLVGRPPFERESREETYQYIQRKDPALPTWMSEPARDFITCALAKSPRKRPSMAQLLHHPWIVQHARRPSIPPTSPAVSDLHIPLSELAGAEGSPFGELHRVSMHGTKSIRDLNSLLSPSQSASPHLLSGMLQPALSMAGPSMMAAAAAAVGAGSGTSGSSGSGSSHSSGVRPTTASSRLGANKDGRPVTPLTGPALQALAAGLPSSAFPAAFRAATAAGSPEAALAAVLEDAAASEAGDAESDKAGVAEAPAGEPDAGAVPALRSPSPMHEPAGVPHSSFSLQSHSLASKLLSPSFNVPSTAHAGAAPAPGEPQGAFLELYKSLAPPAAGERLSAAAPTPRGGASRKASAASLSRTSSKVGAGGKASETALPPLQQQQHQEGAVQAAHGAPQRLPSLRKALSQPIMVHMEEAQPLARAASVAVAAAASAALSKEQPAPTAVEAAGASAQAAALPAPGVVPSSDAAVPAKEAERAPALSAIPESSSDAEPDGLAVQPLAKVDSGHMVPPAHKQQPEEAASAGEEEIAAVHAQASEQWQGDEHEHDASPMLSAQAAALDRMRAAEQRHVDKLRARSATVAVPAGPADKEQRQQRAASASYGSGLAKSASSLLNKLLGKKPAAGSASTAGAGAVPSSAASPARPRKASSVAAVERSAVSASAPSGGSSAAEHAGASNPPHKYRLSPPTVSLAARAGPAPAQAASPRSRPSQLPSSGTTLFQRRSAATAKPPAADGRGSVVLRSPVGAAAAGASSRRLWTSSRVAPADATPAGPHSGASPTGCAAGDGSAASSLANAAAAARDSCGGEEEAVASRTNSKSVRFAGPGLSSAGPSCEVDTRDLIQAVHHSDSASFTTAFSSLPPSSLPSLTSGTASPLRASRKGSASPAVSRKHSHATPAGVRAAGGAPGRLRGSSKMVSMPGEGSGAAPGRASGQQAGHEDGEDDTVQRSAASWSHPASASAAPGASPKSRMSSAAAARLSMYMALQRKAGTAGGSRAGTHKPVGRAGGEHARDAF